MARDGRATRPPIRASVTHDGTSAADGPGRPGPAAGLWRLPPADVNRTGPAMHRPTGRPGRQGAQPRMGRGPGRRGDRPTAQLASGTHSRQQTGAPDSRGSPANSATVQCAQPMARTASRRDDLPTSRPASGAAPITHTPAARPARGRLAAAPPASEATSQARTADDAHRRRAGRGGPAYSAHNRQHTPPTGRGTRSAAHPVSGAPGQRRGRSAGDAGRQPGRSTTRAVGGKAARGAAVSRQTLKYLASGWWATRAEVACSGWSWNSSDRVTPIRSGSSSWNSCTWSSRLGQAG
ncbi:hypothetical protein EDD27_4705 [Nonomuraea polychroma]|uniref:Uncharacterized protein n=1 Tax=Nonomuraea polychroma TaxID=46176 RepID=A0A438M8Q9_9ACTN|nr:hypothetical protein EDD27_4705 [Nonomuraea polychroma]